MKLILLVLYTSLSNNSSSGFFRDVFPSPIVTFLPFDDLVYFIVALTIVDLCIFFFILLRQSLVLTFFLILESGSARLCFLFSVNFFVECWWKIFPLALNNTLF